jgi:hypothetical protein
MSALGHERRFDSQPVTSGLLSTPDISLHRANCRDVPKGDITILV